MKLNVNGRSYEVEAQPDGVIVNGVSYKTTVLHDNGDTTVRVGNRPYKVKVRDENSVVVDGRPLTVALSGKAAPRRAVKAAPAAKKSAGAHGAENGAVRAMMPGTVVSVRVNQGDRIEAGAVLLVLEAMKMQNEIKAPTAGLVARVAVTPGQTVANGDALVVIE